MLQLYWDKSLKVKYFIALSILCNTFCCIESKQRPTAFKNKLRKEHDHRGAIRIIIFLICITLLPVFGMFCYNVYMDPATPDLMRSIVQHTKSKLLGFLSSKKSNSRKSIQ